MTDKATTLQELKDLVAAFVDERDWRRYHAPKNLAMGMAIEAGELMEHFLWIDSAESEKVIDDPEQMQQVKEELADVLCYAINMAVVLDIDLSEAFKAKMQKNAQKYPADDYRGKYKL